MSEANYFHIPTPQIVHETIEGETVIVNLLNGNYYNINGVGAVIWQLIVRGASRQQLIACLEQWYSGDQAEMHSSVKTFLDRLEKDGLAIPAVNPGAPFSLDGIQFPAGRPPYEAPITELAIFTDMQNLLLLDPVHEVTDQGWPHTAPGVDGTAPDPA